MNFQAHANENPAIKGSLPEAGALGPRPGWVPETGTRVTKPREHFDVVRILGARGAESAEALREAAGEDAGPILRTTVGSDTTFFIVEHLDDSTFRWPPGIRELGAHEALPIPAFDADEGVVEWLSRPTAATPFVIRNTLRNLLITSTGWVPMGDQQ